MIASVKYAWRNLSRNRRRTLITLIALAVNTCVLIASFALIDGYIKNTIRYVTDLVTGEAQIHAEDYLEDTSLYKTIDNPSEIIQTAESNGIEAAPRQYGYGLVATESKSAGAQFQGVDPEMESRTFTLPQHVWKGEYLSETPSKGMILGKKLAKTLQADVGSEIVVVVQAYDGSLSSDIYTVTGILKSASEQIDRGTAMIHQSDFQTLFAMPDSVHEIALNSYGKTELSSIKEIFKDKISDLELKTWRELNPMLSEMVDLTGSSIMIFGIIFFIVGGLGIMNTMLMATFERIREFGILKALGASSLVILRDVLLEALLLGFISTILGVVLGLLLSWYLVVFGINTSSVRADLTYAGIAFDPVWRASLSVGSVVKPVIMMWIISFVASIYPAVLVSRLRPVDAMKHT